MFVRFVNLVYYDFESKLDSLQMVLICPGSTQVSERCHAHTKGGVNILNDWLKGRKELLLCHKQQELEK